MKATEDSAYLALKEQVETKMSSDHPWLTICRVAESGETESEHRINQSPGKGVLVHEYPGSDGLCEIRVNFVSELPWTFAWIAGTSYLPTITEDGSGVAVLITNTGRFQLSS